MSASDVSRHAATFIVRMWSEHAEGEAPQWRGQVEHIQSGDQEYFHALDRILDFIVARRDEGHEQPPE